VQYAVELFAGGGGLAVGLRRGGLRPIAAVEVDEYAAATFAANHPDVTLIMKDIREVNGHELLSASPSGTIDILAACPPCQGFSTLTSKYRRSDDRNILVKEVARIAGETLPLAIMMENVPGLAQRGLPILTDLIVDLEKIGYVVDYKVLQVADYGVPQMRRRLVLLAGLGFRIAMPRPTHSKDGRRDTPVWRTLRDVIGFGGPTYRIDDATALGGFESVDWRVVRKLGGANLDRLRQAQPGKGRGLIPKHMRPLCHQNDISSFRNTYGRLEWDKPASTITSGCLSPSKGRFGHPDELRTISLREAAILQTFPVDYRFIGDKIDKACGVVGNALPCLFAERIAAHVALTADRVSPWLPAEVVKRRRELAASAAPRVGAVH